MSDFIVEDPMMPSYPAVLAAFNSSKKYPMVLLSTLHYGYSPFQNIFVQIACIKAVENYVNTIMRRFNSEVGG